MSIKAQPRTDGTGARRARSPQPTTRPALPTTRRTEAPGHSTWQRHQDHPTHPPPQAQLSPPTPAQPRPAPTIQRYTRDHTATPIPRKEDTNNQRGGQKQMHVMFPSPRVDPHSSANLRLQRQQSIRLGLLLNHTTPPLPLTTPTATPPPPLTPTTITTCSRRPQTPSRCPGRALGVFGLITSRPLEIAV